MNNSIYENIIETKTNSFIPVLKNGKTLESRYNPEREAEQKIESLEKPYNFYLVLGICSGILLNKLSDKFPESKIIAVEYSQEDLNFLNELNEIQKSYKNKNIYLTSITNLKTTLLQNYIPALYGNLRIIENNIWVNENKNNYLEIKKIVEETLIEISADFSVQSHFGKVWQNNIIKNLKILSEKNNKNITELDNEKKALIIAAGPTLDKKIKYIKENQNNSVIISTDTGLSILLKNNIKVDVVISLDGQLISSNHFINKLDENTLFLFDLTGNFSAAKKILNKNGRIHFFTSGHPLSEYSNLCLGNSLLKLNSGFGTVTIAALDFALKSGFSDIEVLGADFAYSEGKAYAKGSYLDNLYAEKSKFSNSLEKSFDNLLFRTELIKIDNNKYTTSVLNSYKESLEDFLNKQNIKFSKNSDIYKIKNELLKTELPPIKSFSYKDLIHNIYQSDNKIIFLPYISWLRKNGYESENFDELCNLAQSSLVRYN